MWMLASTKTSLRSSTKTWLTAGISTRTDLLTKREKSSVVWVGMGKGRAGRAGRADRADRADRAGRAEARQTKVWITDMEERWRIQIEVEDYLFSDRN